MTYSEPREGIKEALSYIGPRYNQVVVLSGDLSSTTKVDQFKDKYPKRYIECGIAEQNMISVAAGLSLAGYIPIVAYIGAFIPARAYDQIRIQLGFGKANVKIIATHTGLNVGGDGASHQMLEDIALMRVLPNLKVIAPATKKEAKEAVIAAVNQFGPVYVRLPRAKTEDLPLPEFKLGKAVHLKSGKDLTLISTGSLLGEAFAAANEAEKRQRISIDFIHLPTVKPLDSGAVLKSAKVTDRVLVVEEAQAAGGLGGAVAELLVKSYPCKMGQIAVRDSFGRSGNEVELLKHYRLDREAILEEIEELCL